MRTNNKRLKKETKIPNTKIIQKVNKPAGVIFINTEEQCVRHCIAAKHTYSYKKAENHPLPAARNVD